MKITEYERFIATHKGNSVDIDWRATGQSGRKNKSYAKRRKFEMNGKPITARWLATKCGMSEPNVQRLLRKMTPEEVIEYAKNRVPRAARLSA